VVVRRSDSVQHGFCRWRGARERLKCGKDGGQKGALDFGGELGEFGCAFALMGVAVWERRVG
jgi:hypothetical protein